MGKGKAKIEIKKIESLQARNVCFSKRRKGLFKKAEELGRLFPEARIAAVVFSPAGNPYVFGDPRGLLSGSNDVVPDRVSETQKLLAVDFEEMSVDELEAYASQLEKSRSALLLNGDAGDMASTEENIVDRASKVVADSALKEITENNGDLQDDTSAAAASSLCLELPILDFDFSEADFDGLGEEAFVNQFLNL